MLKYGFPEIHTVAIPYLSLSTYSSRHIIGIMPVFSGPMPAVIWNSKHNTEYVYCFRVLIHITFGLRLSFLRLASLRHAFGAPFISSTAKR